MKSYESSMAVVLWIAAVDVIGLAILAWILHVRGIL